MEASLSFPFGAREDMRVSGSELGEVFLTGSKGGARKVQETHCTWDQNSSSWVKYRTGNGITQVGDRPEYPIGRKACAWARAKQGQRETPVQ